MWARINGDRVAEITDIDPKGRFHPSLKWVKFDGRKGVKPGWSYTEGEFIEPPREPLSDLADRKRRAIESARKDDEAQGITLNGARYSGSPGNRQSLSDALDLANEKGFDSFEPWKDSDDVFHASVPVVDIREARSQIIQRRADLIARGKEKFEAIDAAVASEDRDALNAIEW